MKIKQGVVAIEPITIIAAVVCLVLGAVIGFCYRKQIAEAKVGVAEKRANDIVEDAKKEAEAKKETLIQQLLEVQPMPETEDMLERAGHMEMITRQAEEIILHEVVYQLR